MLDRANHCIRPVSSFEIHASSLFAACIVANALRPTFGSNDPARQSGAEILDGLNISNWAGVMMVDLARRQSETIGDGSSTAVIICGAFLQAASRLLEGGKSVATIEKCLTDTADEAVRMMTDCAKPVDVTDPDVITNLCSGAPIHLPDDPSSSRVLITAAVDSILDLDQQSPDGMVCPNLENIRIVSESWGKSSDSKVFSGILLQRPTDLVTEFAPVSVVNANVALIRYWLLKSNVGEEQGKRSREYIFKEDRKRILNDCRLIKKSGARVVLITKDEHRDESSREDDVNLKICVHYLAKMDIMAISDLEEAQVRSVGRLLGCASISHPSELTAQVLGRAERVDEVNSPAGNAWVHFVGTDSPSSTVVVHGSSEEELAGGRRSVGSVLTFVGNLFRDPSVLPGCGFEVEASLRLKQRVPSLDADRSECVTAFANALEIVPYTLAENMGLPPEEIVVELRRRHAQGQDAAGLSLKHRAVVDSMHDVGTVQPLAVLVSAVQLAATTANRILGMDVGIDEGGC